MVEEEDKRLDETAEHEADPAEGPPPRGNQEVDQERLDRDLEDLDHAGAN